MFRVTEISVSHSRGAVHNLPVMLAKGAMRQLMSP